MTWAPYFAVGIFVGMLLLFEAGRRIGIRVMRDRDRTPSGVGAIEGAVFGLLGLMLAFTFSGAASRFDDRRHLIVEEANDIGTAWLRLDLLPAQSQPELRQMFRDYLTARLESYGNLRNAEASNQAATRYTELQSKIWNASVAGCAQTQDTLCGMLLLPALNGMIDITTTRTAARQIHPPLVIFIMLAIIVFAAAMMAGYGMSGGRRSWLHIIGFVLLLSSVTYVILDLEYPRFGLIRVDAMDQVLRDLLETMK